MGVPKTIDNDLPITDHCPGYGSCAKYIATSIKEIIRDNESFNKSRLTVCIVEIMGRHAGWLAAAAALAKGDDCSGVDAIYLPETTFDLKEFLNLINDLKYKKDSIVIAVSEGVKTTDGRFVCELNDEDLAVDAFGHKQLSGCATTLCHIVAKETGLKTRAIELSTLQRAASHIASLTDIEEAEAVGARAVEEANKGNTGMMVTLKREQDNPYKCTTDVFDVHHIANAEKKIPLEWIDVDNNYVKEELVNYLKPLIQGEVKQIYKDGLPQHINLNK
jgi:6-phosphofructokinase 1